MKTYIEKRDKIVESLVDVVNSSYLFIVAPSIQFVCTEHSQRWHLSVESRGHVFRAHSIATTLVVLVVSAENIEKFELSELSISVEVF